MLITNSHIRSFNIYLLPFILFVTSYLVFGFYYASSDDATLAALIRGVFFSHPVTEFFQFHRITAILYARFYELFPNIPWYGIFMHALLLLAITNYFILIHRHFEKFITNYGALSALLIIFYTVFFLDSVISITFTKVSVLLATSSILLIIDGTLRAEEVDRRPSCWSLSWYLLLFVLAFLTRPQGGMLAIVLLAPFALLYNPGKRAFLRAVSVFVALISIVGLLKIYDYTTRTEGSRYYWSVQPYVFNIYDARRDAENLAVNYAPKDLIKYRAVIAGSMGDREIINAHFLSRVASDQSIRVARLNPIELARAVQKIGNEISPYGLLIVFMIDTAALALFIFYRHELPFIFWVSFLTFSFLYWSIVVSIAVLWKMPDRLLSPAVTTYVITCVLFISAFVDYLAGRVARTSHRVSAGRAGITSLWILVFLVLFFAGYRKLPAAKLKAGDIAQMSRLTQVINRELEGKLFVFTFGAFHFFVTYQPLLSVVHLSDKNQYMLVDGTWPTLLPEYPRHLKEITGSDRLSDVFQFLLRNREKVIFVSTPSRNAFIREYFASLYNNEFKFEEFQPGSMQSTWVGATQTDNGNQLGLYTINARSK